MGKKVLTKYVVHHSSSGQVDHEVQKFVTNDDVR